MPSTTSVRNHASIVAALAVLCLLLAGCADQPAKTAKPAGRSAAAAVPPELRGTIAQHAIIRGNTAVPVEGYCLVVGLGKNGSSEVPLFLEKYLVEYLKRQNLGSRTHNLEQLTPMTMIRDLDTAVVQVRGIIPPGARKGSRFDLVVNALPATQTKSLDGGRLMPTELFLYRDGVPTVGTGSQPLAMGGGDVFINPFLDVTKESDRLKFRSGRIIGGGKVLEARPLRLELYEPNWGKVSLLARRINEAFSPNSPIAKGKNMGIDLMVPQEYEDDFEHFVQLVMHLPLASGGPATDVHATQIAKMMEVPGSKHEDLALILEAMGNNVIGTIRSCYTSSNESAAFFAARTGLRLGDDLASEVVIKFAQGKDVRLKVAAIKELGKHRRVIKAAPVLRELADDENEHVRQAAYEAMLRRGDKTITTINVNDDFKLDIVPSKRSYCIYATQAEESRLALFGKSMPIAKPVYFCSPDEMVTINALAEDAKLMVRRRIPGGERVSDPFYVDFRVAELVSVMGRPAVQDDEGKIAGLNLSYSQVVAAIYRMCKDNSIKARFVLQPIIDNEIMSASPAGTSRLDMEGS